MWKLFFVFVVIFPAGVLGALWWGWRVYSRTPVALAKRAMSERRRTLEMGEYLDPSPETDTVDLRRRVMESAEYKKVMTLLERMAKGEPVPRKDLESAKAALKALQDELSNGEAQ